jgi:hypothetical protein
MADEQAPLQQPLLGLDFVFAAGQNKIEEQGRFHEAIDVKMGVLIALLGAFVAGLLAALFASEPTKVSTLLSVPAKIWLALTASLLTLALYFSFQAFRTRHFYAGIKFRDLVAWSNEEVRSIKQAFLPTLLKAVEENESSLRVKQQNAKRAIWVSLLVLLSLLGTAITIVVRVGTTMIGVVSSPGVRPTP